MSDIHGCLDKLKEKMELVDLQGDNRIVFLGDYIDYGRQSGQVLQYICDLQSEHGTDKVIVLKGNHEDMILTWIDEYSGAVPGSDEMFYDSWFKTDSEQNYKTFRTLVTEEQLDKIREIKKTASFVDFNKEAVRMVLEANGKLVQWMRSMLRRKSTGCGERVMRYSCGNIRLPEGNSARPSSQVMWERHRWHTRKVFTMCSTTARATTISTGLPQVTGNCCSWLTMRKKVNIIRSKRADRFPSESTFICNDGNRARLSLRIKAPLLYLYEAARHNVT